MLKYEKIMKAHPEVEAWLKDRPVNTARSFAEKLMTFCESVNVSPEEWRRMDRFQARDLAWKYIEPLKGSQSPRAAITVVALKSWFRNFNGEVLPLDSAKGGKHNIHLLHKKAVVEHIPNKEEMYRLIDMAGNLRDKALLLTLFQSGIRVNALCKLKYGDVAEHIDKDIIPLRITSEIDDKLRGANIPFYMTFLNGEASITLRQYARLKHKNGNVTAPLFYTKTTQKPISHTWVLKIVKKCVARAGMDPKTIWTHSIRKAFRKIVRQTDIDDDTKEQLMGHVLRGSREAYFDRYEVELIKAAYEQCNFSREIPGSEVTKLRQQLEDEMGKRAVREEDLKRFKDRLDQRDNDVERLNTQINQVSSQLDTFRDKLMDVHFDGHARFDKEEFEKAFQEYMERVTNKERKPVS